MKIAFFATIDLALLAFALASADTVYDGTNTCVVEASIPERSLPCRC